MKWLRRIGIGAGTMVFVIAVLHFVFDLGIEFSGGFRPRLVFIRTAAEQAQAVEAHRETQRAELAARPTSPAAPGSEPSAGAAVPRPGDSTAASVPEPAAAPYWTDVRGPLRDGVYRERALRAAWPDAGLTPLWKQPVGGGYASFVIARGRAFTIEQRGDQEVVAGYDVATGRELWTHRWRAFFQESMGGDGPRATPTWFDGRVYALGAAGELRALDESDGRLLWRANILEDARAENLMWGMAASPLVVDGALITLPGGADNKSVVAYDRLTGRPRWSAGHEGQAYSSPMIVTLAGRRQLLVFAATAIMGLAPESGAKLWSFPWQTQADINVAQPIVIGTDRVFLSSGYGVGAAVLQIEPAGDRLTVREVWRTNRMKNRFSSSVVHNGFVYGLDEGILACLDASTGDLKWKAGRYGHGQLVLAGDRLIVLTEDGDLVLVAPNPQRLEEIGRSPAISGKTWNHPAIADGRLLVRNASEMAAFDLRPDQAPR